MNEADSSRRYSGLIESFLAGEIEALVFEREFTDLFVAKPPGMPIALHEVLSALHLEIEAFVADEELLSALRDRHANHHHIDESQLRAAATAALSNLQALG